MHPLLTSTGKLAAVAILEMAAVRLGLVMALVDGSVSPVWPATGVGIALVLLMGYRVLPGIFAGALLGMLTAGAGLAFSAWGSLVNTLEPFLAVYLIRRYTDDPYPFSSTQGVFKYCLFAGLFSTAVSATLGVGSLSFFAPARPEGSWSLWWTWWWLGNMTGAMIVAPILLAWARQFRIDWRPAQLGEACLMLTVITAGSLAAFGEASQLFEAKAHYSFVYLTLPVVVWLAVRFGERGSTTATLIVLAVATSSMVGVLDPAATMLQGGSVVSLQVYLGIASVTGLALASAMGERDRAQQELKQAHSALEVRVQERTLELTESNARLEAEIVDRKQAERALRDTGQRLKLALDGAGLGLQTWYVQTGKVAWDRRTLRMFGYSAAEIQPNIEAWKALIHPEDWPRVVAVRKAHFGDRQPMFEVEFRARTKSEEWKWLLARGKIVEHDREGKPLRVAGTIMDISDRKSAEESLRKSEAGFRAMFDSMNDAILVCDSENGRIIDVNRQMGQMYGYTTQETKTLTFGDLSSGEPPYSPGDALKRITLARQGDTQLFEWRGRKKSGKVFWVEINLRLAEISGVGRVLAVVRDISDRKKAEQEREVLRTQLLQAQKTQAIGTLAGGIAHDFNNMLTIILGYSEILLSGTNEQDPAHQDIQRIVNTARHGSDLVKKLLTFSRQTPACPQMLDLNRHLEESKKLLLRTLPNLVRIELVLADSLAPVKADPAQIDQILVNLALNANDAMTEEAGLTIETKNATLREEYCKSRPDIAPGDYVLFSVSDTGRGMDEATIERIFDPFFTTKGWDSRKGTGLGLAVVQGIVRQHGGFIECASQPGHGATFTVYLPAMETIREPEEGPEGAEPAGGTETLLLVDDEELIRDLGIRYLGGAGYTVLCAANGKEALEVYARDRGNIALVILDLAMPEMGGEQCLKELLNMNTDVKVVLASGYSPAEQMQKTVPGGARAFIGKPYDRAQLLKAVRIALDRK